LEIDSFFAGTRLKSYISEIDWRATTNYAAAIDDDNDFYFDDVTFKRLAAHPMYCSAVTWPVVARIWEYIEAADFPMEILATQVHYSEHIRFYRLVASGDRLHVSGKIAAILPHRAGTHVVLRFDVTDDDSLPVFTEHIGSIMRGVTCIGGGKGEDELPRIPRIATSPNERNEQQPVWTSEIFINRLRPFIYDGCSNIVFPIHTSKKFAGQVGLPDIILQGTATLGYAVRELVDREAGRDPARITSLSARFSGMVIPGTAIKVVLSERKHFSDRTNLYFYVKNQSGETVIKDGFAQFLTDAGRRAAR